MSTKKYLYIVLTVLIGFVGFVLYWSGKSHVEVVVAAQELKQDNSELQHSVDSLDYTVKVIKYKYAGTDSLLVEKDKTITNQKKSLYTLMKEAATKVFARESVVYIHDTIYITEKKSFWGKTKTSIAKSITSIDSASNLIEQEPILVGSVADTTK
jgi:hypothetical protein